MGHLYHGYSRYPHFGPLSPLAMGPLGPFRLVDEALDRTSGPPLNSERTGHHQIYQ